MTEARSQTWFSTPDHGGFAPHSGRWRRSARLSTADIRQSCFRLWMSADLEVAPCAPNLCRHGVVQVS